MYKDRYYIGTHLGHLAVFDTQPLEGTPGVAVLRSYGYRTMEHAQTAMRWAWENDCLYEPAQKAALAAGKTYIGDANKPPRVAKVAAGPTLAAGLTSDEYWEMTEEYRREQDDLRRDLEAEAWVEVDEEDEE